jgi:hypothetical protein
MTPGGMRRGNADSGYVDLVGGPDIDIAVFGGMRADYGMTMNGAAHMVTDAAGNPVAMMTGIERVHFDDMRLAFDDAAVNSARMISAAFGAQAMTPHLNGVAMSLFDQGLTMREVAEIALANMGHVGTNEEFVDEVYTNVVGRAPHEADREFYAGMLDHMGRADMLVMAASSDANAQQIDLVGIAHDGMMFF